MLLELIKHVCKEHAHCSNSDICPLYDRTYGECMFEGDPASWSSESEIRERLEEFNNA